MIDEVLEDVAEESSVGDERVPAAVDRGFDAEFVDGDAGFREVAGLDGGGAEIADLEDDLLALRMVAPEFREAGEGREQAGIEAGGEHDRATGTAPGEPDQRRDGVAFVGAAGLSVIAEGAIELGHDVDVDAAGPDECKKRRGGIEASVADRLVEGGPGGACRKKLEPGPQGGAGTKVAPADRVERRVHAILDEVQPGRDAALPRAGLVRPDRGGRGSLVLQVPGPGDFEGVVVHEGDHGIDPPGGDLDGRVDREAGTHHGDMKAVRRSGCERHGVLSRGRQARGDVTETAATGTRGLRRSPGRQLDCFLSA